MVLSDKRSRFVEEYLVDLNATQAAVRAGYSPKTANEQGAQLLANPIVKSAVEAAIAKRSERTGITADQVLERWWQIATADPNDVMQYRRVNCRHCWGINHAYQWKDTAEFDEMTCDRALDLDSPLPDNRGGFGFDGSRKPHPECPSCKGDGHGGYAYFSDTRDLSGAARLLYAGVKTTRDGVEMKVHDQTKALENVARHLGMFVERKELSGKDGGPIQHTISAKEMTDDELARIALGGGV